MKTTGLTLQEALQALVDGKCRAVRFWDSNDCVEHDGGRFYCGNGGRLVVTKLMLASAWSLIDPVQEYEEVEVVRWAVLTRDGYIIRYLKSQSESDYCIKNTGIRIIKMTGIDRVPKKEKVTRRVEVEAMIDGAGYVETSFNNFEEFVGFPETHGKTGRLIFEWEE